MQVRLDFLPLALALVACAPATTPATSPSPGGTTRPSASPSTGTSASPAATASPTTGASAPAESFTGTITVARDGKPLRVGPQFHDLDYGYTRDFAFGAYNIQETAALGDDEVGVVWTDGNLADNSSNIKLRLNLKSTILEVGGVPGKGGTDNMPGTCTKEMSADKLTLVRYTYEGKMLDTNNGRKPTAETYSVELKGLSVARK
jgi:hypothetical protein